MLGSAALIAGSSPGAPGHTVPEQAECGVSSEPLERGATGRFRHRPATHDTEEV